MITEEYLKRKTSQERHVSRLMIDIVSEYTVNNYNSAIWII